MLSSVAIRRCGLRYVDRGWRRQCGRVARPGQWTCPGAEPRFGWGSRWRWPFGWGRRRRRMPVPRAAAPPMAPAISRRTIARAARCSCSAVSRAAFAVANRAGAAPPCPGAPRRPPRSVAPRATWARPTRMSASSSSKPSSSRKLRDAATMSLAVALRTPLPPGLRFHVQRLSPRRPRTLPCENGRARRIRGPKAAPRWRGRIGHARKRARHH
jgi:hypothetical protein